VKTSKARIGNIQLEIALIRKGTFLMGFPDGGNKPYYEPPQRQVTLTKSFWLGTTPVTQALWETVMGKNPSFFKGAERPVESVSWNDCQDFLRAINSARTYPPSRFRLPTEEEWEYAFKAGGDGTVPDLDNYAWYRQNSDGSTHPVGEKRANAWGLHDMLGNVWEWCADKHGDGPSRVIRGGSWFSTARYVRAACRLWLGPDARLDHLGFRLALNGGDVE
jgi:formylglycine-generating enzyme required for sulfatase activity